MLAASPHGMPTTRPFTHSPNHQIHPHLPCSLPCPPLFAGGQNFGLSDWTQWSYPAGLAGAEFELDNVVAGGWAVRQSGGCARGGRQGVRWVGGQAIGWVWGKGKAGQTKGGRLAGADFELDNGVAGGWVGRRAGPCGGKARAGKPGVVDWLARV